MPIHDFSPAREDVGFFPPISINLSVNNFGILFNYFFDSIFNTKRQFDLPDVFTFINSYCT